MIGYRLYTPRLQIRRAEEKDTPLLAKWSASKEAHGDWLTPDQASPEDFKGRIAAGGFWNDREKMFIIELRQNDLPIGTIHYWSCSSSHNVIMALKIALPDERGKGYGTEAQKFLIIDLFTQEKVKCIEMYTDIDNIPQQRCLQKLGFTPVRALEYDDQGISRTGLLYQLATSDYHSHPVYQFHYEL